MMNKDDGLLIILMIIILLFIGIVFVTGFLIGNKNYNEYSAKAGFCYGKEGIQIYPYSEIGIVYFNYEYTMNLTDKIDCNNLKEVRE